MQIKEILLTGVLCAFTFQVRAQQPATAAISGNVTNEEGKPVPAATIQLSPGNKAMAGDANGHFRFTSLAAGTYTVRINALGYEPLAKKIILAAGQQVAERFQVKAAIQDINSVAVVGFGKTKEVNRQAYNVQAVDARQLHNTTLDLGQLMNRISGVRIRESGGTGSEMRFSLNGFSGRQVKFFLDGVPMDNFGTSFQLNNIPVNFADRIEVYKGVVPVWLGGDALGGAVNIVTSTRPHTFVDASYSYGSFNTHKSSINAGYVARSGFTVQMNAFQNYSDNNYWIDADVADFETGILTPGRIRRFHDRYHNETLVLRAGVTGKKYADRLLIGGTIANNRADIQTGNRVHDVYGARWRSGNLLQPSLQYSKKDLFVKGLEVRVNANFNLGEERAVDTANKRYSWDGSFEYKDRNNPYRKGGEVGLSDYRFKNNNGSASLAADYKINEQHSLSLNEMFTTFDRKSKNSYDPDNIEDKQPHKSSKYITGLGYRFNYADKISATAFVKHYQQYNTTNKVEKFFDQPTQTFNYVVNVFKGNVSKLGYGAAGSWFITNQLQFKTSYEKAYRLPDNQEMFGDMINELGNMSLRPESSDNINVGAVYNFAIAKVHAFEVQANFIFRNSTDYIRSQVGAMKGSNGEYLRQSVNDEGVTNRGIDAEIHYAYKNVFLFNSSFTYQNIRNSTKHEMLKDGTRSKEVSPVYQDRIPNMPYMFGNANAAYVFDNVLHKGNRLSLGYNVQFVNQFYLFWPSQGEQDTKKMIPTQWAHDASLTYTMAGGRYNVAAECLNLTDASLYDNFKLPKPSRAFNVKLRYYFSWKQQQQ
ncbi:TonB-dependent receptor [Chitinophaga nivalis]|uniref:TonB-dependent receptor n=1 Tax=Chitinophaga nivalis TaxID=2991709 RepID=A0ABT3ILZ8_9BACT|nr:TonB-dependent receptor [Chitinophaga nivalis]MCW3465309.1 TonB-dependent receptor [Chitinophaga nivalis]MCW3484999.1 TonB-dependent receptor [Chitinophaga nivalis]